MGVEKAGIRSPSAYGLRHRVDNREASFVHHTMCTPRSCCAIYPSSMHVLDNYLAQINEGYKLKKSID